MRNSSHALKHGARHVQRPGRAGQRLAAGIVDHLGGNPRRQDQGLAEFEREVFDVADEGRHLQRFDGARRARGRESAPKPAAAFPPDYAGSGRARWRWRAKNMSLISAASFGCIDRFDAIRICASVGGLTVGAAAGSAGISSASGTRRPGLCGFSPSLLRTSGGVRRIDRKPRPHRRARRVVDLIDQAGGQFDKLPRFVVAVRAGSERRDRSARAAEWGGYRRPRGGRASSARRSPERMEVWSCQGTRLSNTRRQTYEGCFNSSLRKTIGEGFRWYSHAFVPIDASRASQASLKLRCR